jgi:hypothetical protein
MVLCSQAKGGQPAEKNRSTDTTGSLAELGISNRIGLRHRKLVSIIALDRHPTRLDFM